MVLVGGSVTWPRGLLISWETEIMSKEAENRHSDNFVPPTRFHLPLMSSNYRPRSRLNYCVGESLHDPTTFKTHQLVTTYHTWEFCIWLHRLVPDIQVLWSEHLKPIKIVIRRPPAAASLKKTVEERLQVAQNSKMGGGKQRLSSTSIWVKSAQWRILKLLFLEYLLWDWL